MGTLRKLEPRTPSLEPVTLGPVRNSKSSPGLPHPQIYLEGFGQWWVLGCLSGRESQQLSLPKGGSMKHLDSGHRKIIGDSASRDEGVKPKSVRMKQELD